MNNKELLITALIIVFATLIIRFLPFVIIRKSIAERKYIKFLGDMMPYSMIALLVIYCLKEVNLIKYPYGIPELISIAIIIILHIIKRNVLISIGVGTVIYIFGVIMGLYEYLSSGFGKAEDLNCAEKILYGANEIYDLGIDKNDLKMAAGFGGGMGVGITCGIITGCIMAFSKAFIIDKGHESSFLKEIELEFITRFQEKTGETNCIPLVEKYRSPINGCDYILFEACKIFDDIMNRYYKK